MRTMADVIREIGGEVALAAGRDAAVEAAGDLLDGDHRRSRLLDRADEDGGIAVITELGAVFITQFARLAT